MASVSYGLNRGANQQPEAINVGTLAITTYDVELRMNLAKALNTEDVVLILQAFIRRLENGYYGPEDLANI